MFTMNGAVFPYIQKLKFRIYSALSKLERNQIFALHIQKLKFKFYSVIASRDDELKEISLRWFGHVQCRPTMALVRKSLFAG